MSDFCLSPQAMTHMIVKHGLANKVQRQEVFSPWSYHEAGWIVRPNERMADRVGTDTTAVHLFNQMIRAFKDQPAPAGSFLERLQREGA